MRQEKETAQNQDPQKKEDASSSSPPEEEGLGLILKVKTAYHDLCVGKIPLGDGMFFARFLLFYRQRFNLR